MNTTVHFFNLNVFGLDKKLNLLMMITQPITHNNNQIQMGYADQLNVLILILKLHAPLLTALHVTFKMENVFKFRIVHQFKVYIIVEFQD